MESAIEIKKGFTYTILSMIGDSPVETEGEFLGYTLLGMMDSALVLRVKSETGKKMIRMIPIQNIYMIDYKGDLEDDFIVPDETEDDEREKTRSYIS